MFDLKKIKSIPCGDIASKYGIKLEAKHGRLWGKLRPEEKTASFSINTKNNLWYDFGSGKGGSVIDLVAEIEGISPAEAIHKLAEDYGITSEKTQGWRPLTNGQYKELGIQPESATMNFKFDLNKHSVEQLERWSNKYGMPVKDLAKKYPNVYNKMVEKIAMEGINALKDSYNAKLKLYRDPAIDKETKEILKGLSKYDAEEINRKLGLLQRAVTTPTANYMSLKVNFQNDFKSLDQEKVQEKKSISEDEIIRNRIVKAYKKLYNFHLIDHFSAEQARALNDINRAFSNAENYYFSIEVIRQIYKMLGEKLEKLESEHNKTITNGDINLKESKFEQIKSEILKVKDLFNKCNTVIEGIREATLIQKNEQIKQNTPERSLQKNVELTQ